MSVFAVGRSFIIIISISLRHHCSSSATSTLTMWQLNNLRGDKVSWNVQSGLRQTFDDKTPRQNGRDVFVEILRVVLPPRT